MTETTRLHFGLQNLYDQNLDEWILLDQFDDCPGDINIPNICQPCPSLPCNPVPGTSSTPTMTDFIKSFLTTISRPTSVAKYSLKVDQPITPKEEN